MSFSEKLALFNQQNNDLPRRILLLCCTFGFLYLFVLLFRFIAPFVLSIIAAWTIHRPVKWTARKLKVNPRAVSLTYTLLLYGLIFLLIFFLISQLFVEVSALLPKLIEWIRNVGNSISVWLSHFEISHTLIPEEWAAHLNTTIQQSVGEMTSWISSFATEKLFSLAGFTVGKVFDIPGFILFIVVTIMGTFYFSSDEQKIFALCRKYCPPRIAARASVVKNTMFKALLGQLWAAVIMFFVTTIELVIGFLILGVESPLLMGVIIALLDALPVLGAGLFLIPMCLYGFIFGDFWFGMGMLILYLVTIAVRQMLEPRVIGHQLGMHPLLTMVSLFVGYIAMGFLGMLIGPTVTLLCMAVLSQPDSPSDTVPSPTPSVISK